MATNAPTPTYVQVRLDPAIAAQLREAGEAQGRKLPAEIVQRLTASLATTQGEKIGAVVAALVNRISLWTGSTGLDLLAQLKVALPVLLDELAPTEPVDRMAKGLVVKAAQTLGRDARAGLAPLISDRGYTAGTKPD